MNILNRFDYIFNLFARISLFILVIGMTMQVLSRYFFHFPLIGFIDLVEHYLMPMIVFFSISYLQKSKEHVNVEILYMKLSDWTRKYIDLLICMLSLVFFVLLLLASFQETIFVMNQGYNTSGDIIFPLYTSLMIVPIGSLLMVIRLLIEAKQSITSIIYSRVEKK